MNVNPKFVDVNFPDDKRFVFGAYGARHFAAVRQAYEDAVGVIPRDEWGDRVRELDESDTGAEWLVTEVKNQRNEGSCVGNMGTQGLQVIQCAEVGASNVVLLSAISCYKQIGSSPNSGAMVDDCLDSLTEVGVLPLDTPANRQVYGEHVMPATGFYAPWPSGWKETAKKFRLAENFVIKSVDGIISALLRGHPVGVGRAGHSILYLRPVFRNKNYGDLNSLLAGYVNSWGEWGQGMGRFDYGFGFDSMGLIRESAYWAFAFRAMKGQ